MAAQEAPTFERAFVINWVLMNVIGIVLGTTARRFVFNLIFGVVGGGATGKAVEGAVIGAAIGMAQLFALPPPLKRSPWWVVATIVGWGVGWSLGWSAGWGLLGGFSFVFATIGFIAGAVAGILQWPLLQGRLSGAHWWILGSTVGWGIGLAAGMFIRGAFGWPVAGAVSGIISGAFLYWLLQRNISSDLANGHTLDLTGNDAPASPKLGKQSD